MRGDEDIEPGPEQPFVDGVHAVLADLDLDLRADVLETALASVRKAMASKGFV